MCTYKKWNIYNNEINILISLNNKKIEFINSNKIKLLNINKIKLLNIKL